MARAQPIAKAAFAGLARPGAEFAVRVTPNATRAALEAEGDGFRIAVTETPEAGRANRAVARLLARALGVAPGRLTLLRGASGRDKLFRLD
jgi:uncharacterized protein YggU (UPF0235/DUF167 family)